MVTFPKIYPGLYPEFISKFELVFTVWVLFHDQELFYVYVFCWNDEYNQGNVSRTWVQKV